MFFEKSEAEELNADKMNLAALIDAEFPWRNWGVITCELCGVLSGSSNGTATVNSGSL